jgi:hypothetical protein
LLWCSSLGNDSLNRAASMSTGIDTIDTCSNVQVGLS